MSDRSPPHLLYQQAVDTHAAQGTDAVRPACPRYQDNDRRLPCGWLPGEDRRTRR